MAASYQMLFELNAALGGGFTSAFTQGSQQIENMKAKLDSLNSSGSTGDLIGGISAALETAGVIKGLEEVYDTLKECAAAAAEFETSMAGVKRTVGGDDAFIDNLGESFKKLSTQIPITAGELASIATTAGQLGIAQDNVEQFTTVMAQLGTTTDLSADSAATMLAQFANITGTTEYDRLGATVAALGDSTATTASKVVEMSQGMAAAASQAGMSETDILAIAASVGSLGIEAASGSTSMSTLISTLYKATETGGEKLEEFASVAGMSAEEFQQSWGEDAVGTMNTFIQGLNDTERNGRSAVVILDELGIKNVRQTKAILGLASAGDLLSNSINLANNAWSENAALGEKAGIMYDTTEAKMTMLQNAVSNLQIGVGDALTPAIGAFAEGLTGIIEPIAEFVEQNPAVVQGITAFVGVLGVATAAVTAYTAITKLASAANLLFAGSIPGVGIIVGVAAAIAGLVAGVSALTNAYNEAHPSFEELDAQFDSLNEKAKEQQNIIDLAEEYKALSKEISDLETSGVGEITETIDISGIKKTDLDLLKEIANNNGYTVNADGTVTQTLDITGVSKKDIKELQNLSTAYVEKKATLTQELKLLGIENVESKLPTYMSFKTNTKEGTYALKQQLEIDGAENLTDAKVEQLKRMINTVSSKEGKLTQKLELLGFDAASISSLGYTSLEAFVAAVQSGKIITSADGTLTQKLVMDDIKPEAVETIQKLKESIVTEKGVLEQDLELRGVDNVKKNLDTYLSFKVNTKEGSYALEQQLTLDGAENITAEQLKHLKEFIRSIQNKEGKLTQTLTTSGFDAATIGALGYSSMESFVAAVEAGKVVINANGTITQTVDVSGDLAALKEANEQEIALAEAQNAAAAASDELAAKRERLREITDSLRASSNGMVSATDSETEALRNQIDAYEAVAQARKDSYTAEALDTIKKQSRLYVQSLADEVEATRNLEEAQSRQNLAKEFLSGGDALAYLHSEFESLTSDVSEYGGFTEMMSGSDEAAQSLRDRFYGLQEAINVLDGTTHDFTGQGFAGMEYAIEGMTEDTIVLSDSWGNAINQANEYADQVEAADKIQQEYIQNLVTGITDGTLKEEELEQALNEAYKDYENGGNIVAETMNQVRDGVEAAKAAAEGSGSQAQEEASTAVAAVGDIISQMEALKQAYDEAKESASKALGGVFGLFDEVGDKATSKTTQQMQDNLAAQADYWDQYNKNLQTALDNGLAPEIAQQLADGSAESAAALETLANSSAEDIQKINESFAQVEAMKDTLSSTIADMTTNFSDGMNTLKEELNSTVAELNKGSEAAQAAAETMEAYVKAIGSEEGEASEQANAIADAVNAALATIADVDVNINYHENGKPDGIEGEAASGTESARRGVYLVGENGPELVYMNGGETVLNAERSAAIMENTMNANPVNAETSALSGNTQNYNVTFSPQFNVAAGVDATEVTKALETQSVNLREQFESIMAEVMEDQQRRMLA